MQMLVIGFRRVDFYPRPPRGGRRGRGGATAGQRKFLSTPSARRATHAAVSSGRSAGRFLSTPSARRATHYQIHRNRRYSISIHALREEGDPPLTPALAMVANFYPRPPRGGRPQGIRGSCVNFIISIHALREEGDVFVVDRPGGVPGISIHALREEGDGGSCGWMRRTQNFYPRPPRGGRLLLGADVYDAVIFLSTPSARRATNLTTIRSRLFLISIHALREEGDNKCPCNSYP